jgi:glutaminase
MRPMADVAPQVESPIQAFVERLHDRYARLGTGRVATYIPELARADPDWFGIAIATVDGRVYEAGDTRNTFTIQSISKPLTYGLALEDRGRAAVLARIGVEPTGEAFNSISLAPDTGAPLNPLINAGAIAATSLVAGSSPADRLERLLATYSLYAGRRLSIDQAVYASERATGHRNRAIGHMLRNFDILEDDPEDALDLYFRQCSALVDCRDLALVAATLANGGINPLSGERALRHEFVGDVLSVMATCGMYDYAGEWMHAVGLPAKSGVGGGILAVLPGQLGIAVFSPPLDEHGNSVRGIAVCKDLSSELDLHLMRVPRAAQAAVRARYTLEDVASKRQRTPAERAQLGAVGGRARVYVLQGDLLFSAVEAVARRIIEESDGTDYALVDFRHVTMIEASAGRMLLALWRELAAHGKRLVLADAESHPWFVRFMAEELQDAEGPGRLRVMPDLDTALEWCEDRLLAGPGGAPPAPLGVSLAQHELCRGLDPEELAHLETLLEPRGHAPGELIVRRGEAARELFLLLRGKVSVTFDRPDGRPERLATLMPGMAFGEMAVVNRGPRTADVRADTAVECRVLSTQAFDRLSDTHPRIKIKLLENLLRNVATMLAMLNRAVATLSG